MDDAKPGWQTTEFWLTLIVTLVSWVVASGIVDKTETDLDNKVLAILVSVLTVLGYNVSRGLAKMRR